MSLTIREEKILEAAIDKTSVPLEPVTRREMIFAKAAGSDVDLPPAQNKEEQILSQLAAEYAQGGGGGGGLSFQTANVSITFDTSDVGGTEPTEFEQVICYMLTPIADAPATVDLYYGEGRLPISLLGNPHNMTVPIYSGYGTTLYIDYGEMTAELSINSGAAELINYTVCIFGDCSLTATLHWQD